MVVNNTWDVIAWFFWMFIWIAYLMVIFSVIVDVFRDHSQGGWAKAAWILFIVFVPFIAVLVYVIARGKGMAMRQRYGQAAPPTQGAADDYYASVMGGAGTTSVTDEISKAKALLDSGTITQAEYERLKASALA